MINLVLTYNIDNASKRTEFVEAFEKVLTDLGLHKEYTNQSTYFGPYSTAQDFVRDLFNAVSKMVWSSNDVVTIYYPRVKSAGLKSIADIGRHAFKSAGNNTLNHIIFKT
jgi:hypothetical protein